MPRPRSQKLKGESATTPLDPAELQRILACPRLLDPEHLPERSYVLMALRYALRASEAQALTFGHVAGRMLFIAAKKRGNTHKYEIDEALARHLDTLRAFYAEKGVMVSDGTFLFMTRKGRERNRPMTTVHLNRFLAQIRDDLALKEPISTHTLRKTAITRFHDLVQDPFITRTMSRHRSILSLDPYVKAQRFTPLHAEYLRTLEGGIER